jgi:hypothetical protein
VRHQLKRGAVAETECQIQGRQQHNAAH